MSTHLRDWHQSDKLPSALEFDASAVAAAFDAAAVSDGVAFGCAADAADAVAAASETAFETGDVAVASEFALAGPGTAEESAVVAAFDSAVGLEWASEGWYPFAGQLGLEYQVEAQPKPEDLEGADVFVAAQILMIRFFAVASMRLQLERGQLL